MNIGKIIDNEISNDRPIVAIVISSLLIWLMSIMSGVRVYDLINNNILATILFIVFSYFIATKIYSSESKRNTKTRKN